jgi:hypothetical protein
MMAVWVISAPLASHTNDGELVELIAPFYRYGINMRQFSAFISNANQEWLHDLG